MFLQPTRSECFYQQIRCVEWYMGCLCKFLRQIGAKTGSNINYYLRKMPKSEKAESTLVIQASDRARNIS
jgi:hypothetical protein